MNRNVSKFSIFAQMGKKTIIGIVLLMGTALFGLITLQVYWVNTAFKLKEQQFSANVDIALKEVVFEHERNVTASLVKSFMRTVEIDGKPALIIQEDTIMVPSFSNLELEIEEILGNGEFSFMRKGLGEDRYEFNEEDHLGFLQAAEASDLAWVTKVIKSIMQEVTHMKSSFDKKVDLDNLDAIINKKLHRKGIELDYLCAVTARNKLKSNCNDKENEKLLASEYKVNLFPSQLITRPTYLHVYFPQKLTFLLKSMWFRLSTSIIFILIIIFSFAFTVWVILRQKKLSEIKNDFINNMTHEFKTPITTISLAGQAIRDPDVANEQERLSRFSTVILEESKKLSNQVEKILQMAIMDKGELNLKISEVNMHDIIEGLVENCNLRLESPGNIRTELNAENPVLYGDIVHLTNVIDNLIDNSIKYAKEYPDILIKTFNDHHGIKIVVIDKGIGMSKDTLKKIFDRFYRISTGNVHNVKGFGLGLTYVKTMVNAHHGKVSVKSELDKGTTFELYLPIHH